MSISFKTPGIIIRPVQNFLLDHEEDEYIELKLVSAVGRLRSQVRRRLRPGKYSGEGMEDYEP